MDNSSKRQKAVSPGRPAKTTKFDLLPLALARYTALSAVAINSMFIISRSSEILRSRRRRSRRCVPLHKPCEPPQTISAIARQFRKRLRPSPPGQDHQTQSNKLHDEIREPTPKTGKAPAVLEQQDADDHCAYGVADCVAKRDSFYIKQIHRIAPASQAECVELYPPVFHKAFAAPSPVSCQKGGPKTPKYSTIIRMTEISRYTG